MEIIYLDTIDLDKLADNQRLSVCYSLPIAQSPQVLKGFIILMLL